jgi:hypothetical protein
VGGYWSCSACGEAVGRQWVGGVEGREGRGYEEDMVLFMTGVC